VVICLERGADCLHMVQLMPLHLKLHNLLPDLNLVSLTEHNYGTVHNVAYRPTGLLQIKHK